MTAHTRRKAALPAAWLVGIVVAGNAHTAAAVEPAAAIARGHAVFAHSCASCHGAGPNMPGTMALHFKYNDTVSPLLEQRGNLTPDLLRVFVRRGVSMMPSFRKTELSDSDIEALAAYLNDSAAKLQQTR
ncbi:c-type cytochrome [Paraburkholderia sp. HP33-1]|uniref:c-type cytochrome n=1 Tax=Paraburkholderia sp. HP33-1 TaxID=2883243 RepID=UPI001F30799F|nr:cytochrome c [Paraburkholderia sp. HP33-1]